jgi:perosamine synthetase
MQRDKKCMNAKNNPKIPLAIPTFDKEMERAALNALHSENFVGGESVARFEEEFARYCGVEYAVAISSGTAALQLSMIALGINKKSNVVTTPFSFIATANSVLHAGATPIFADVDQRNFNIDPREINHNLTKQTKAILPVHLYGYPCEMEAITKTAKQNKLRIVEDACQAHGAQYYGQKVGTIGDVGCFSFYPSKNMTVCGDGGMVVTSDKDLAGTIAKLRDCGRRTKYEHDVIGYTARLNTVNAAIGRVQLRRLDEWNEKRIKNALFYDKLLADVKEVVTPSKGDSEIKAVYHLYVVRAKQRDKLKKWLEDSGIQTGVHYPLPIHLQPIYKLIFNFRGGEYPISETASKECLSLPMYPSLEGNKIRYICERIREFYNND